MAEYSKNIAVIKGVKSGFSCDGAKLTGLVKAEKYGAFLRAEVTLINFAPLSEGRYVISLSDGANEEIFGESGFEGESEVDTSYGFAAAVCFVNKGQVSLIGAAVCGDYGYALDYAKRVVEQDECAGQNAESAYDDEAIAGENYYEKDGEGDACGGDVCQGEAQEKETICRAEDETNCGVCEEPAGTGEVDGVLSEAQPIPLAQDIGFYERMKPEIDRIFDTYPEESELERVIEDSRWAKISYGNGKYYVFGLIFMDGKPRCICYGVPSKNAKKPPESLDGSAGYIPVKDGGYWVMYQDAGTGTSIKIDGV